MSYPVSPSWQDQSDRREASGIEAIQDRFNRLLGDAITGYRGRTPTWHPDIDVYESADGWTVEVRLPGVAPEEVMIDVRDRELVVRAASTDEDQVPESGWSRYSDFAYRVALSSDVDVDGIDAMMDHGLLVVLLPRSAVSRTRRIPVARRIEQNLSAAEPDRPVSDVSEATGSDPVATAAYDIRA
jgi:HSP20 family molecular chaperone IbpA